MKKLSFKNNPRLLVNSVLLFLVVSLTLFISAYVLSQRNRYDQTTNEQVASQPDGGEALAAATETVSPTPNLVAKNQKIKKSTPSPAPQQILVASAQISNSSSSTSPSPTSSPESTPTPTPEPSPTPTPDATPFDATLNFEKDLIIISANKPLQKCEWIFWISPMGPVWTGEGTINGNVCTIENIKPDFKFSAQVVSILGDTKTLGNSPPNYR